MVRKFLPFLITATFIGTILIFVYWLATVAFPIVLVESSYQVKKTMMLAFGTTDIRTVFLPTFHLRMNEQSNYEEGSIVIPALFLDEPVIYNVDPNNESAYVEALKKGIAHASSTRLPDNGGLGYYFAHSSSPSLARQYNAVFYLLGKLQGGERITLWHEGIRYDYQVTQTKVTVPEDVSFLIQHYDEETIVLQTCWPPGTTERRKLVFAKRVAIQEF